MIPAKERMTYDELKIYHQRYEPTMQIGWSDAFPGASAWLADRDYQRIERERSAPDNDAISTQGMGRL